MIIWRGKLSSPPKKGTPCPKCKGLMFYSFDGANELVRKCLCGHREYLIFQREGLEIQHVEQVSEGSLPKAGSLLRKCIWALASSHPELMTTEQVAIATTLDRKNVSAYMMVLMHKGLAERAVSKKGIPGGSLWQSTELARKLLKLQGE